MNALKFDNSKKEMYRDDLFYHDNEGDTVWWYDNSEEEGTHLFSFDKKKVYNLFADYPQALTPEEKEIFDRENPFWADFFTGR